METFLWGIWNGITAWPLLIVHVFGGWHQFPVYNIGRDSGWYQFGFLIGTGSPLLGLFGRGRGQNRACKLGRPPLRPRSSDDSPNPPIRSD